ncbi:MAG: hypothetical protein JNK04_04805 [Myxococcales bacterium]|nr:hypothetical protein [Myxococcales bacterium]
MSRRHRFLFALPLVLAACWPLAAAGQEVEVTPEARAKFKAGVALLQDPDGARYEEAYLAFKAAYAISPSPNILGNLGLSAMKLERDGEAIDAYTTYLAKGTGLADEEKRQIETDLTTMKSTLATLELKVEPPNASIVDERIPTSGNPVRNRYGQAGPNPMRIGMRAGVHRLKISLEGYQEQVIEIELSAGAKEARTVKLEPAKAGDVPPPDKPPTTAETERPIPVYAWVTLGLTGALAVGTGVTGGLALANKSKYDELNDGTDPAAAEDSRSKGKALNIATDVLLGTTVAAAGVTLILILTRPEVEKEKEKTGQVEVHVVPTGTGLSVLGSF